MANPQRRTDLQGDPLQTSTVQEICRASHIPHSHFLVITLKNGKTNQVKFTEISLIYPNVSKISSLPIYDQYRKYYRVFYGFFFSIQNPMCAFYTYSATQFQLDPFQVLSRHMWLVAATLETQLPIWEMAWKGRDQRQGDKAGSPERLRQRRVGLNWCPLGWREGSRFQRHSKDGS